MNVKNNELKLLYMQLEKKLDDHVTNTTVNQLKQDGQIAKLTTYVKDNLSNTLRELYNSMVLTGEISGILTEVIVPGITSDFEALNRFYNGVTTKKLWDEASGSYYYVTTVPAFDDKGNKIEVKMGIANDDPTMSTLENTLNFAWRKNATLTINCGVHDVNQEKPLGCVIYEGKIIYRAQPTETPEKYQYFAIKHNGEYSVYPVNTTPEAMLNDGVKYATLIFATLLSNGNPVLQTDKRKEPRQSVGITSDNSLVFITCDGRNRESEGMSYDDLARLHSLNGSINAYIFDGGGSSSTVLRGIKQNENSDNLTTDRSVSTFLYVAKPTSVSVENNTSNDVGRLKQFLIGQIRSKVNFEQGFIRIMGKEGFMSPGFELYANGEEFRRSKYGLSLDSTGNINNTYLYIGLKANPDINEKTNLFRIYDRGVWVQTYHGTSSERPAGIIGLQFFDETLGKPIWFDGSKWVDYTGAAV